MGKACRVGARLAANSAGQKAPGSQNDAGSLEKEQSYVSEQRQYERGRDGHKGRFAHAHEAACDEKLAVAGGERAGSYRGLRHGGLKTSRRQHRPDRTARRRH